MEADTDSWESLAEDLQRHGVPERRAQVVALVATGHTHAETQETLGLSNRGNVGKMVGEYREQLSDVEWLADHAPEL